jgi:hypothetical protein
MSDNKTPKLGTLKLTDAEKQAIAEMVETPGFKVWKKKVIPNREVQIAGLALSAIDVNGLYLARGCSSENRRQVESLQKIADDYNKSDVDEGEIDSV